MAWPPSKSKQRRSQAVDLHLGIAVDEADDAAGSWPESVARGLDAVAADIEQGAAAGLDVIADVGGIVVEVAEKSGDRPQLADAA